MKDPGTIRAAERKALESTLRGELRPLAFDLLNRMDKGNTSERYNEIHEAFMKAAVVIRRVQARVGSGRWRSTHYPAENRALCGLARPAVFLTRRKKHVTCSRCCKRLGLDSWKCAPRAAILAERHR